MKKRYLFYGQNGIEWTPWFTWNFKIKHKWQSKNKLKNEYKED